jgi:molybdopterin-guanine dinucleotide biosynthesis protein A
MGSNKALLQLHPGGPTLIETVVARLREADLPPTLLVTNTPQDYAFLGIQTVLDDIQGAGALGGILTALSHSPYPRNLIVACDMPLLNPALLKHMASLPDDNDAIVPRWTDSDGRLQVETLHAIYSTRCIEPIRRRIVEGKLKVADLLNDISVRYLEGPELRRYDPHLNSFRNINTPGELEALRTED